MKKIGLLTFVLITTFVLSGCVVRTYQVAKDRVDQELSGNRGYVTGKAPAVEEEARKETRSVRVLEMELGWPFGFGRSAKKLRPKTERLKKGYAEQEAGLEPSLEAAPPGAAAEAEYQEYKVEKNDTLQKISQKFYGTTKKWKYIYDYNADVLKSPDKVYPGLTLKIPVLPEMKKSEEATEKPAENLK